MRSCNCLVVILLTAVSFTMVSCRGGSQTATTSSVPSNPAPSVTSISPSVIAVGAPDSAITVTGANFISASEVELNGTALKTVFVSSTQLTATVPASSLANGGSEQVAASNPSPGGGTSAAVSLTVVAVSSFVILAAPQNSDQVSGRWEIAVAATDSKGAFISGLPVTLGSSLGTLDTTSGVTDSKGTFASTLTPPSNPGAQALAVTATTGSQTAAADISFSTGATPSSQVAGLSSVDSIGLARAGTTSTTSSSSTTLYSYPFSLGIAGNAGSTNAFADPSNASCATPGVFQLGATVCPGFPVTAPNIESQSCHTVSQLSTLAGLAQCAGTIAIPAGCATSAVATVGLSAIVCGGTLTAPEIALAAGCGEFLAQLFADYVAKSKPLSLELQTAIGGADIVQCAAGDIASCFSSGADAVGVYCSVLPSSQLQGSAVCSGSSALTTPICPSGQTCVFVTNAGSNKITVYNEQGSNMAVPSGAFPNLNIPDGIAYDSSTGDLYVENTGNNSVTAYDLKGNEVCPFNSYPVLFVSGVPEDIRYDQINDKFYVPDTQNNRIIAFDKSGNPVGPSGGFPVNAPWDAFWDRATGYLYVSSHSNNSVLVFDEQGNPISTFSGVPFPDDLTVDPATGNVYVTQEPALYVPITANDCTGSGITVFDLNGKVVTPTGGFQTTTCPDQLTVVKSPGSNFPFKLFVSNIGSNKITVYDKNGNDITSAVAPGGFPGLNEPTGMVIISTP